MNRPIECWKGITEEESKDVESLREKFSDDSDFRSALEDYFHVYDDWAEMNPREFSEGFKKYTGNSVTSSVIGDIKDAFSLGNITEAGALKELMRNGKSKKDALNLLGIWKKNGIVKSSVDKAVKKLADYFGEEAVDNIIPFPRMLTNKDKNFISGVERDEDVTCNVGWYSVTVMEKESPAVRMR